MAWFGAGIFGTGWGGGGRLVMVCFLILVLGRAGAVGLML